MIDATENRDKSAPSRPCPLCGKLALRAYWPFCSRHCADVDLARWLNGSYCIGSETDEKPQAAEGENLLFPPPD